MKRLSYKFVSKIKSEPKETKIDISNLSTATPISSYFAKIGPKLAAKIASNTNLNHVSEIGNTTYLEPKTEIEVLKEIKKHKNKSSLDHIGFSSNLLKTATPSISSCLCDQFNKVRH